MRALIGQARQRQHRRRIVLAVVVVALCAAGGIAYGLVRVGGHQTAGGTHGLATIARAGTKYIVVKPSGHVIRLCFAPAPTVKFSPAPTTHNGWVADAQAASWQWEASGPVTACKR